VGVALAVGEGGVSLPDGGAFVGELVAPPGEHAASRRVVTSRVAPAAPRRDDLMLRP